MNGYEEVAEFFQRRGRPVCSSAKCLYTGDFSTMYTTIPHQDLIDKLRLCLTQAWNWQATQKNVSVDRIRLEVRVLRVSGWFDLLVVKVCTKRVIGW